MMNPPFKDPEMIGIFGEPKLVTEHHRPTMVFDPEKENRWGCGYWWNFWIIIYRVPPQSSQLKVEKSLDFSYVVSSLTKKPSSQ